MKIWRLTLQSTVVNFCRKSCVSLKIKYPIIVRQYTDVIDSPLLLLRKPNTTNGAAHMVREICDRCIHRHLDNFVILASLIDSWCINRHMYSLCKHWSEGTLKFIVCSFAEI